MPSKSVVTRFAPSPTGYLHLGHAYSALRAFAAARQSHGHFLLRIEDIDAGRCRPEYEAAILEDLSWLGLEWDMPVRRQSDHFEDYAAALERLREAGLIYPCFCTRKDIREEIARSPSAPHGPEGPLYPGTCRGLSQETRAQRLARGEAYALRLDVAAALARVGDGLHWHDRAAGRVIAEPATLGDVVLARKDTPTSYHLAVTVDDHLQDVSLIVRGEDLFHASHLHRLLQALLGFAVPDYLHHALLRGEDGRRFAKRDAGVTLQALRDGGATPQDIRVMVGLD